MEKLKIYSAYLPYGLKIECHSEEEIKKEGNYISELSAIFKNGIQDEFGNDWDFNVKPILFSLEDLTKEITIGGETFVPLHKILEEYCFNLKVMSKEEILSYQESLLEIDISYKVHSLLLEWKFNVFNLPETEYIKVTEENNPYD